MWDGNLYTKQQDAKETVKKHENKNFETLSIFETGYYLAYTRKDIHDYEIEKTQNAQYIQKLEKKKLIKEEIKNEGFKCR